MLNSSNALPGRGGLPVNVPPVLRNDEFYRPHLPKSGIRLTYIFHQKYFPTGIYTETLEYYESNKDIPFEITLLPQYLGKKTHKYLALHL